MSKKTATIIISIFTILVIGGLLAFYFLYNQGKGSSVVPTNNNGVIFPGGGSANGGNGQGRTSTGGETSTSTQTTFIASERPILKELSIRPSAGAISIATSSSVRVRFVERGSGNVFEVSPENDAEERLSNTTIPKIEEALWNKDGIHTVARYTAEDGETIKTYSATLTAKSSAEPDGKLQGSFFNDDIKIISENPDQNRIFYLLQNSAGATGILSDFDGGKKVQIFDSQLQEWLSQWSSPTTISLATKPSASVPGFMFFLNTQTGVTTKIMSGINGLATLVDPTSKQVLFSASTESSISLKIYTIKDRTALDTPISTLPEKCIWSKNDVGIIYCSSPAYIPEGIYPDSWYMGQVLFSDEIWKINSKTGAGELLIILKKVSGKDIDGTNLFFSPNEDYLFFTNKKDFHIWSLRLVP